MPCVEAEDISFYLLAQSPVKARMRYALIGLPEMNECDLKRLKYVNPIFREIGVYG